MNTPKIDIIVTRHTHLVTVLIERGIATHETPVLTHVDSPEQVEGLHVAGVLPHHLSCRAASVTEIPMRWTEADREAMQRGDVDLDGTRRAAGEPITYSVHRVGGGGIDRARPRWLAVARAYEHVERYGYHFGSGPGSLLYVTREWRGLPVTVIGDASETSSAEVIESRGVWRPECRGPWLDGYGREVADDDIAPAPGPETWTDIATDRPAIGRLIEVRTAASFNHWGRLIDCRAFKGGVVVEMTWLGRRFLVENVVAWRVLGDRRARREESYESAAASPSVDFDAWLTAWWPEWQRRHGRGVSATIDPDEREALREAWEAGAR